MFSFHSLLLLIMLSHQAFVLVLSKIIEIFDRAIFIFEKAWRTSTLFAMNLHRLFGFWGIYHYPLQTKRLLGPVTEQGGHQRPPSMAINTTTTEFLWIARSAILVIPQNQNIADRKISGFERKAFTRQNVPDSKVFGFKVPTLDSGFKISGDMNNPGCFHFGSVLLCVNGKQIRYYIPDSSRIRNNFL